MLNNFFKYLITLFVVLFAVHVWGQDSDSTNYNFNPFSNYNKYRLPSIGVGIGASSYFGDISSSNKNEKNKITSMGRFCVGVNFYAEQRLNNTFGLSLNGMVGKLSENKDYWLNRHFNFSSKIFQGDINLIINLDNNIFFRKNSRVAPFLCGGFGFMTFEPKADLLDENGKKYYYWRDGTIRDQAFDIENPQNGNILYRDYNYETTLDSTSAYKHNALSIPIGGGLKIKLSDKLESKISAVYYFTNTDYVDGYSCKNSGNKFFSGNNDGYFYAYISIHYNLAGKPVWRTEDFSRYADVDFDALDNMDSDADGVRDEDDRCPETPVGAKVDNLGCPLDDDKDGVPNYADKELNTPAGTVVNDSGVTLTPAMMEEKYIRDSLIMAGVLVPNKGVIRSESKVLTWEEDTSMVGVAEKSINNESLIIIDKYIESKIKVAEPAADTIKLISFNNNVNTADSIVEADIKTINESDIKQPETGTSDSVSGIMYRVQIASLSTGNKAFYFKTKYNIQDKIFVDKIDETYKYSLGSLNSYRQAAGYCDEVRGKVGIDAFIVAFRDGKRIDPWEARSETGLESRVKQIKEKESVETKESVKGIVYKIQIASLNNNMKTYYFKNKYNISEKINVEFYEGTYKYIIGAFSSFNEAKSYNADIRKKTDIDTFIVAYKDGVRISTRDARDITHE